MIEALKIGRKDVTGLPYDAWPHVGSLIASVNVAELVDYYQEDGMWPRWCVGRIPFQEALNLQPVPDDKKPYEPGWASDPWTVTQHLQRIRNLMEVEDLKPISIEFLQEGDFSFDDGNHRLLAAYLRGDTHIPAKVSGFLEVLYDFCSWEADIANKGEV